MKLYRIKNKDNFGLVFEDLKDLQKFQEDYKKYCEDIDKTEKIIKIMRNMINQCRAMKLKEFEDQLLGQIEHNIQLKANLEIAKENLEFCELYGVEWNNEKEDYENILIGKLLEVNNE